MIATNTHKHKSDSWSATEIYKRNLQNCASESLPNLVCIWQQKDYYSYPESTVMPIYSIYKMQWLKCRPDGTIVVKLKYRPECLVL